MTDKARIKIAAALTALFLGAMSAAGIAVHSAHAPVPPPTAASSQAHGLGQPQPALTWEEQGHD